MSDMYAIKASTLTAIGDAVRSKTSKYIYKDTPWEKPIYSIDYDTKDYDIVNDWKYLVSNQGYVYEIKIPLKELLGDDLSMYAPEDVIGRPKFLINFKYESNMEKSLQWDFCVSPKGGGSWNDRYVSQSSTFLSKELIDKLVEPSINNRDFSDYYYIYMVALKSSVDGGFWFKFHFDIKVLAPNNKYVYLNTYTPLEMAETINKMPIIPEEALTITGNCQYKFSDGGLDWLINAVGDKITTNNITNMAQMFQKSKVSEIPFELNGTTTSYINMTNCFNTAMIKQLPKINVYKVGAIDYLFSNCYYLREIRDEDWNVSIYDGHTSTYTSHVGIFGSCYSLRRITPKLLSKIWTKSDGYYYSCYNNGFNACYVLDELINLPVAPGKYTSNAFSSCFSRCYRLKDIIFETNEDGTPKTAPWKSQTIDLSSNIGYSASTASIINYNSGITADKEVKDDATYQALKDDPDWFTIDINYSRYNHNSAVNTINSLPDCSATGTNTIKFKGASGSLTDGGAINTLTEEEIAVASAKGWTVSFV